MNSYGTMFGITLYGESHQENVGAVITGMPPGVIVDYDLIELMLARRKPGVTGTTSRIESDHIHITSGIKSGVTTGAPINLYFKNENINSRDYDLFRDHPRPGHADYVANIKYQGFNDINGGGHFSGRLTTPLVAGGCFAQMITNYQVRSEITQLGRLTDLSKIDEYINKLAGANDSVGGVIKLTISGLEVGLGTPFFNKLDSELAKMLFTVPAVKGVVFGNFNSLLGSEYNDLIIDGNGKTMTNNAGGINGGISNGNDIVINVFIKPTSSIGMEQNTYNFLTKKVEPLQIVGRHDTAIIRRIGVVLESVASIVLADQLLISKAYK